jgi:hypothetical protein
LHEVNAQAPVAHEALPFARLHGIPQPPQFESVVSEASQPFGRLGSQSPH